MDTVKQWLASKNITTHTIVAAIATLVSLYAAVPEFRNLVMNAYSHTPTWVHEAATAAFAIYAFYHRSDKQEPKEDNENAPPAAVNPDPQQPKP